MDTINTEFLERCLLTLEQSYTKLKESDLESIEYEIYRNALIKGFELTLEQSGKLLKKRLSPYFATKKALDRLNFKDIFREAHKHSLLEEESVERWFNYRENRNNTAHEYGIAFAEETLNLMDDFIRDTNTLIQVLKHD